MSIWSKPRFLRRVTIAATAATAFHCTLLADYTSAAGEAHCFTWIQGYYRAEVIEPVGAVIAWGRAKYFPGDRTED